MKIFTSFIVSTSLMMVSCQTKRVRTEAYEVDRQGCGDRMSSSLPTPPGDTRYQDRHNYCQHVLDKYSEPPLISW